MHFGGSAVDLIGEDEVGEDGAEFRSKGFLIGVVDHGAEEIGREEIGGELNAGKVGLQGTGEGFDGQGLCKAGDPFKKNMAVTEKADEELVDEVFLSNEDACHFRAHVPNPSAGDGDLFLQFLWIHRWDDCGKF